MLRTASACCGIRGRLRSLGLGSALRDMISAGTARSSFCKGACLWRARARGARNVLCMSATPSTHGPLMAPLDSCNGLHLQKDMAHGSLARHRGERRRREDETQALLHELVHRAQNLLGVVLSMAKLSARSSTSLEAFSERFSGRISSMARSFEVLVAHDWQGAPIRALLDKSLATLDRRLQSRILIKGEDMQLNPLVAQNLALAFHELIANAIDHGSLSDGSGRVSITWSVQPCDSGAREFRFQWTEISAEPKAMEHDPVGFGRNVLETIVPRAINGEATLSNGPQGVIWTLTCPLDGFDGSSWSKPMSAAMTTLENTSTRAHNQPEKPAVEQLH